MPQKGQNFDWDDLKYFLAIARTGTLRGAADVIGANHATVSRRLSILEDNVNARLFDRSKAGLTLTQLGEELHPHALRVEEEITAASRTVIGRDALPTGKIYLSMPHMIAMTFINDELAKFSELYPDIELHIEVSNNIADLDRREADVSIRVAYEVNEDVVGRKLLQYHTAAYCTKEYAAKIKDNGGEGLTFIGWTEPEDDRSAKWIEESYYPKAKLRHRVLEAVPHVTLAAAGMGLSQIPCIAGDRHPDLVRAPFQKPIPNRSIWLLLHKDLRKTARVRLFVDFLAAQIKSRKAEFQGEFI